jgi:hypothetical protein
MPGLFEPPVGAPPFLGEGRTSPLEAATGVVTVGVEEQNAPEDVRGLAAPPRVEETSGFVDLGANAIFRCGGQALPETRIRPHYAKGLSGFQGNCGT